MTGVITGETLTLAIEQFKLISEWYHYAILSLSELPGCSSSPSWIARRLGISKTEAKAALQRLERLKLIHIERGRYRQIPRVIDTSTDVASSAIRKYHRRNLEKAERSLDADPLEARDFSAITMAIDPARLPKAKQEIARFRTRLSKLLERGRKSRVYTLSIQLFPIDVMEVKPGNRKPGKRKKERTDV